MRLIASPIGGNTLNRVNRIVDYEFIIFDIPECTSDRRNE